MPRNNGRIEAVPPPENNPSARLELQLSFSGTDPVPTVSGAEVVVVYIGPWPLPSADQLSRYPELRRYPVIELAPLRSEADGSRSAPLYPIAPGFWGCGERRVSATVECPAKDVTLLHCKATLAAGRYALWCGPQAYELAAE